MQREKKQKKREKMIINLLSSFKRDNVSRSRSLSFLCNIMCANVVMCACSLFSWFCVCVFVRTFLFALFQGYTIIQLFSKV